MLIPLASPKLHLGGAPLEIPPRDSARENGGVERKGSKNAAREKGLVGGETAPQDPHWAEKGGGVDREEFEVVFRKRRVTGRVVEVPFTSNAWHEVRIAVETLNPPPSALNPKTRALNLEP